MRNVSSRSVLSIKFTGLDFEHKNSQSNPPIELDIQHYDSLSILLNGEVLYDIFCDVLHKFSKHQSGCCSSV